MKIYTLIGGVNGAGKSSLTGSLRSERNDFGIVVDPDKLTIQCGGDEYEGGKLAVERIERALKDGVNFTQETTLSGGYPKRLCKRAKEAGYYIRLYYVGLDTAEESIRRIRNRVERGGHDIPAKDVNARFSHRFEDVLKILPYFFLFFGCHVVPILVININTTTHCYSNHAKQKNNEIQL